MWDKVSWKILAISIALVMVVIVSSMPVYSYSSTEVEKGVNGGNSAISLVAPPFIEVPSASEMGGSGGAALQYSKNESLNDHEWLQPISAFNATLYISPLPFINKSLIKSPLNGEITPEQIQTSIMSTKNLGENNLQSLKLTKPHDILGLNLKGIDVKVLEYPGKHLKTLDFHANASECSINPMFGEYVYVKVGDLKPYTAPGEPQLPMKTLLVKLPKSAEIVEVKAVSGEYREIENKLKIVPMPQPYIWDKQQKQSNAGRFILNEKVYSTDKYFPGKVLSYDVGCDNDYKYVFVRVYPLQYIPSEEKATLITDLRINVYYSLKTPLSFRATTNLTSQTSSTSTCVIITPSSLASSASTLADFHNGTGITTTIVTTDEIAAKYTQATDPPYPGYKGTHPGKGNITNYDYTLAKKFVSYLKDDTAHPNLKYVTLLGNAKLVPPSYYYFDEAYYTSDQTDFYNPWIPTDFFYASPDYDLVVNYKIERIPVNDLTQATSVVNKIENWYGDVDYSWFKNVAIAGGRPFSTEYFIGEMATTDVVNRGYLDGMDVEKCFRTDNRFNNVTFKNALSNTGFVYHIGHGSGDSWSLDGSPLDVNELENLAMDNYGAANIKTKQIEIIAPAGEPDFTIGVSSSSQTVVAGNSTSYNITLAAQYGFESPITLSVTGLPSGATGTFDPNPVTPAGITPSVGKEVNASKIDSTLALLSSLKVSKQPQPVSYKEMARAMEEDFAEVSIRFTHELNNSEVQSIEAFGIKFTKIAGEIAHVGTIYGAKVPWGRMGDLANLPEVVLIESVWRPKVVPPLEMSVPEIRADQVWQMTDNQGRKITGKGVKIANFDTGIDVFHPDFFRADGGSYDWIDVNGNGAFDAGTDAADLNGNGVADAGEKLSFIDATSDVGSYPYPVNGTNDGVFRADMDWLYNDANNNGKHDYDTANGFTETDPTYGERLFIVNDANHNNGLDTGEKIIALGTSKIYKTLNKDEVTRTRGVDLIQTQPDTNGHGTGVCEVLSGGAIGRRYVGVAPDADLLAADRYGNPDTTYIPWAETSGADVMLYEFSSWVFEFLDGSSNLEQMIDIEAGKGIIQIVPAGNLAGGKKHIITTVNGGGSSDINFDVPFGWDIKSVFQTVLWRDTSNNLAFQITTPYGSTVNLPGDNTGVYTGDGHYAWSYRTNSPRGTAKFDIWICKRDGTSYVPVSTGTWRLKVTNTGASEEIDGYITDDRSVWGGGATFLNFVDDSRTVTWPATADSAITVASYSTRGFVVAAGDLSIFSGRGPRIDGQHIMDIAAPGNYDIGSAMSKDQGTKALGKYRWFGGTSAAGPHVAAAAALMLQARPGLTHNQVKEILRDTAREDAFTGSTPNENWGYGKLDVLSAVNALTPPTGTSTLKITTSATAPLGSYTLTITGTGGGKTHDKQVTLYVSSAVTTIFDTGEPGNPYPSISGTHTGTITPNKTITVQKLYTHPCSGTGGHTKYVRIYGDVVNVSKTWSGYTGDYHNITFGSPFVLEAGKTYNYEIRTGSYPQIIHEHSKTVTGGTINCTQFTDANGKEYDNWIPAIRLE